MNILIADDHMVVRAGLKYIISTNPENKVIWEAENGLDVLEKMEQKLPELVILDIQMPGLNGLELSKIIKKNHPEIIIIILSQFNSKKKVCEAFESGVNAYLLKSSAQDDLLKAIAEVTEKRIFLSSELPEYKEILSQLKNNTIRNLPRQMTINPANDKSTREHLENLQNHLDTLHTIPADVSADQPVLGRLNDLLYEEKLYTNEKLTLSKTAGLLEIEPHFLSDLVNRNFGYSFPRLLNLYRVKNAMELLTNENKKKSIEIAFESGFSTKSQYNSVFRDITGMTPLQYRKIINNSGGDV